MRLTSEPILLLLIIISSSSSSVVVVVSIHLHWWMAHYPVDGGYSNTILYHSNTNFTRVTQCIYSQGAHSGSNILYYIII